ncbi:MAG: histidinol-phosphate transaminase [Thiohalomonadales bacterium]
MDFKTLICDLAAPGVRDLSPYRPGKPISELQRELGLPEIVKLASNENPAGPSPVAVSALLEQVPEIARYPDGNGFLLKNAIAVHLNVPFECITLGNGSNDVLELLVRAFVTSSEEIIYSEYAFAVYPILAKAVNAASQVSKSLHWGHDLAAMRSAVNNRTRMVFIANPNNPTGTWLTAEELHAFMRDISPSVIVVLDEAYFEYASNPLTNATGYPTDSHQWLDAYPNLVVTRTFSKAYGLAGLRVGYSLSHPDIADMLNRVRQPFNANSLALCAAEAVLSDHKYLQTSVSQNARGLKQLTTGLRQLGLNYIPSVANFICVDMAMPAKSIYHALLEYGVIVRPLGPYSMPNHLRISIGTPDEMVKFLKILKLILMRIKAD